MIGRRDEPGFDVESTAEELPPEALPAEAPPAEGAAVDEVAVGDAAVEDVPIATEDVPAAGEVAAEDVPAADRAVDEVTVDDPPLADAPDRAEPDDAPRDPADVLDDAEPVEPPLPPEQSGLASTLESLLFLSSEPVRIDDLAVACDTGPEEVSVALDELRRVFAPGRRGLLLREIGGGFLLSSAPETEPAARRLLAAPRTPPLTPAQAETLAIVAYLQPVSRPEITRIRGVAADSACNTLTERGMIEEAGRSQFGAVLYRTTGLFLKLFGLDGLADLPDPSAWDPTPEETATLRERLMIAGDARGGGDAVQGDDPTERPTLDLSGSAAPTGHAATEFAPGPAEHAPDAGPTVGSDPPDRAPRGEAAASAGTAADDRSPADDLGGDQGPDLSPP